MTVAPTVPNASEYIEERLHSAISRVSELWSPPHPSGLLLSPPQSESCGLHTPVVAIQAPIGYPVAAPQTMVSSPVVPVLAGTVGLLLHPVLPGIPLSQPLGNRAAGLSQNNMGTPSKLIAL